MRICLVDVDGHRFPNLALMKLSAWHKSQGDIVELNGSGRFDRIYKSKVFTWTPDNKGLAFSDDIREGGTGYKKYNTLPDEIEHIEPDYALYRVSDAYGFLTRGCIRKCPWCVVPEKEGQLRQNADISEFISNKKSAILLDNNVLACSWGLLQIEKIRQLGLKVDFNQGLDARVISKQQWIADLLAELKWIRCIRLACDSKNMIEPVRKAVENIRRNSSKKFEFFVYVLVQDVEDALQRVEALREIGATPFAQPYRDFETSKIDRGAQVFSRWVNHKAVFNSVKWNDYKPRASLLY
jgi:hypothetical protein